MRDLELILEGAAAADAAHDLVAALADASLTLTPRPLDAGAGARHKAVDPVAIAALALSIPATVLAALDVADRIAKRRRVQRLIETAGRIRIERRVEVLTVTAEGARPLAELDADAVLELVERE
jgi:hypothetical protein